MGPRRFSLTLGISLIAFLAPAGAAGAEIVKDGSFESTPADEDNPNWTESGIAPPICSVDTCGDGDGTATPRTGTNWAFFGGVPNPDLQGVSQDVVFNARPATLTFWLWLGRSNGGAADAFRVFLDDSELIEVFENATGYEHYRQVTIDVSAFADGATRTLSFFFDGFGGVPETSISVDDVSLLAGPLPRKVVTLKGPKSVAEGKKAKLEATVQPCSGHQGETIELFRGKKKVASKVAGPECAVTFKVRINRTSTFRAVSPAGSSNKVKVRARS